MLSRMKAQLFACVVLATVVSACGGDKTPTAATPPPPAAVTVTSIAVTGLDAIRTGFFSDYTATATMSNGTTQNVTSTATWTSSTGNATVDANGRLTGQTHGSTVMTATSQGRSGTKTVSIVNNYGGAWSGTYVARVCDAAGAFASASWCRGVIGTTFSLSMTLSQTGNDRTSVSGTLSNAFISNAPVTGNVTGDGRLILGSDATGTSSGVTFRFQLGGWDTRLTSANRMTGKTAVALSATGVTGNAYEEHDINNATLTAPALVPVVER